MSRRVLVIALLLLALGAPAASAQSGSGSGAFDELTGSPTPAETASGSSDSSGGGLSGDTTLWIIGGGLLVAFAVAAALIARDARTALPSTGRDGTGGRAAEDPQLRKAAGKAAHARKERARQKGRAQKAARRKNR